MKNFFTPLRTESHICKFNETVIFFITTKSYKLLIIQVSDKTIKIKLLFLGEIKQLFESHKIFEDWFYYSSSSGMSIFDVCLFEIL
jgi:hypothetical protein